MNPYAWRGFSRHFLLDVYDGYQNVWNVWWVRHSVVDLHTSPYFTHSLHWPAGVTLVPQTMSPLNGLAGIALQGAGLGLAPTVNTIVIASFVATGLTTFWLLRHLESSYGAALLGGLLFTFSSFHSAHAIGHLQLIALEFVPLFVLGVAPLSRKTDARPRRRGRCSALRGDPVRLLLRVLLPGHRRDPLRRLRAAPPARAAAGAVAHAHDVRGGECGHERCAARRAVRDESPRSPPRRAPRRVLRARSGLARGTRRRVVLELAHPWLLAPAAADRDFRDERVPRLGAPRRTARRASCSAGACGSRRMPRGGSCSQCSPRWRSAPACTSTACSTRPSRSPTRSSSGSCPASNCRECPCG